MKKMESIRARIWKLGDHVNTDVLHPPRYFSLEQNKLRQGLKPFNNVSRLETGRAEPENLIILAGENFGCGSSRESSIRALQQAGLRAVIAKSMARIFFRSLANAGIAPLLLSGDSDDVRDGQMAELKTSQGVLYLHGGGTVFLQPLDEHITKILDYGGLIPYLLQELK